MEWEYEKDLPDAPGWYPVMICFDIEEGAFADVEYFDGVKWKSNSITGFGPLCQSEEEARKMADEWNWDN